MVTSFHYWKFYILVPRFPHSQGKDFVAFEKQTLFSMLMKNMTSLVMQSRHVISHYRFPSFPGQSAPVLLPQTRSHSCLLHCPTVPGKSWVGTCLLTQNGVTYFLVVDYFSRYPQLNLTECDCSVEVNIL